MKKKKVLLINPKAENIKSFIPHLGLAVLAKQLRDGGHKVLVLDYSALRNSTPPLDQCLYEFDPDVVGITFLTPGIDVANNVIDTVLEYKPSTVIMVGGPHATLYHSELKNDSRISYILVGEAQNHVLEVVNNAKVEKTGVVIECDLQPIENFPIGDFSCFYGSQDIKVYPLLTSLGCPYSCTFCVVDLISSRKFRTRDLMILINELKDAKKNLPSLKGVRIIDDAPGIIRNRLKEFIRLFASEEVNLVLEIQNMRADNIDQEMIDAMKAAKMYEICIGVESGHPYVFEQMKKGCSLDDIRKAAKLIKKNGLLLRCCFVVGLPHDSFKRTVESVAFAKEIEADFFYWNHFIPIKGSEASAWFNDNAQVHNDLPSFTLDGRGGFFVPEPIAEQEGFSIEDQKKAYVYAIMETDSYIFNPGDLPNMVRTAVKYDLKATAAKSLLRQPFVWTRIVRRFYKTGLLKEFVSAYFESDADDKGKKAEYWNH